MSDTGLRRRLVRLAHARKDLRADLLGLLRQPHKQGASAPPILVAYTNAGDGVEARVIMKNDGMIGVLLFDLDAQEYVPSSKAFPANQMAQADAYARKIAGPGARKKRASRRPRFASEGQRIWARLLADDGTMDPRLFISKVSRVLPQQPEAARDLLDIAIRNPDVFLDPRRDNSRARIKAFKEYRDIYQEAIDKNWSSDDLYDLALYGLNRVQGIRGLR
jgi:hypothetical protein